MLKKLILYKYLYDLPIYLHIHNLIFAIITLDEEE